MPAFPPRSLRTNQSHPGHRGATVAHRGGGRQTLHHRGNSGHRNATDAHPGGGGAGRAGCHRANGRRREGALRYQGNASDRGARHNNQGDQSHRG